MISELVPHQERVDEYLKGVSWPDSLHPALGRFTESIRYSLLGPGKRFRPVLTLLTLEALSHPSEEGLPFGAAVEMIHSYSLIHDDLPCMDNDDERRGRPTNHKVFGETTALLSGDALLTEAFTHIANFYPGELVKPLCQILGKAAGASGMVGGQVLDLNFLKTRAFALDDVHLVHRMKTGALIAAAVEGGAVVARAPRPVQEKLALFGQTLGYAFQVADDILDYDEEDPEGSSVPSILGKIAAVEHLDDVTQRCLELLEGLGAQSALLKKITLFNRERLR